MKRYDYNLVDYYTYIMGDRAREFRINQGELEYFQRIAEFRAKMPRAFFEMCSRRVDLFMKLMEAEMLRKLANCDGQFPMLVDPKDYPSVSMLAHELRSPVVFIRDDLEYLEKVNLITFYTRERLNTAFFEDGPESDNSHVMEFACITPLVREIFSRVDRLLFRGILVAMFEDLLIMVPETH